MVKQSGLFLALAAGTLMPALSLAQNQVDDTCTLPARAVTPGMIHGGGYATQNPYSDRIDLTVYHINIPAVTGGDFRSSGTNVYDDVTFPATAKIAGAITINGVATGFIVPATATAADDHLYTRMYFFPNHDNTVAATVAPYSGTSVNWDLDWGAGWAAAAGFISYYPNPVTFTGSIVLDGTNVFSGGASDNTCGVYQELFLDAALTRFADTWQIARRGLWTAPSVGTTDYFGWFDGTTGTTTLDIRNGNRSGGTLATSRASYLGLQGTGYTPPAPPATAIGCIPDGTTTRTGTLANDAVAWYTVCLNNDATDALGRYLDVTTSGAGDLMQAWFTDTGAALAYGFDRDSGPGTDSQCSFGIGRRGLPSGADSDLDGRHYNAAGGLAAGTYYVAIMPNGSSFGNAGWAVTPTGTGGAYTLTLNTNLNGGTLNPSIAPTVATADDFSATPLAAPGTAITGVALNAHQVRWIKFATCRPTDASYTVTITMNGSSNPNASTAHFLFNSAGNLVAQASDPGPGTVAAPFVFDAGNVLPQGTYYLAQTYQGTQLAPGNDRWHLRSTTGNNGFNFAGEIIVTGDPCPAGCHGNCVADFDDGSGTGTPDGGVTIDDLLYYLGIFEQGVLCADVDDGSGTGTPDMGVTIDDLLYYLFRFEAGC